MKNILVLVIGYFVVTNLKSGAGSLFERNITIGRPGVAYKGISFTGLKVEVILPITNNSGVKIPIQSVEGTVIYKGAQVGTFHSSRSFDINPKTTTKARVNLSLQFEDAIETIKRAIDGLSLTVNIKGTVQTAGASFPYSFNVSPA